MGAKRVLPALLIFVLLAAGLSAGPASATTITSLSPTRWAYVDSAAPRASFVNAPGNAPVGAHVYANGVTHVTKSYVTFSLAALRGNRYVQAFLSTDETAVTDCTNPRGTQVWLTDPASKPTWNDQPAELVKLGGPFLNSSCPARGVVWNATAAVQSALDAGRNSVTLVFRLPDDQQSDPRFGREYSPAAQLTLTYDRPPVKPSSPTVNNTACSNKPVPVPGGSARVSADVSDPDDSFIGGEFALWPVDHPEQRVTFANSGLTVTGVWAYVDQYLTNGATYAWQVRGKDPRGDTGPWSVVCELATDFTPPATAPTVTSTDYTDTYPGNGGTGVPGAFTFSANGDRDVVGFQYGDFEPATFVPADHRGGQAVIRYVPTRSGPLSLAVRGVDAAGNVSPTTTYRFWVASNQPGITCTPQRAFVGEPRQCTFTPHAGSAVTGYTYQVNDQPELTVPADADGTATATVVPTDPNGFYQVSVKANLTSGYQTAPSSAYLDLDPGQPVIDAPEQHPIVGSPATFTVHPVLPGSISVTYRWNGGNDVTVPLDADGTATISVTPTASGYSFLNAHTTTATGQPSGWTEAAVPVDSNQPRVSSAEYPESQTSGGVGLPGTFAFSSPVPGVVSYTYSFNSQPSVTVPAGADGTASVEFTPTQTYVNYLTVTSTLAGGTASESRTYYFYVAYMAPNLNCDNNFQWLVPGQRVQCTLTPVQANVVSYGYVLGSGPEITLPTGQDGSATFDFTVPTDQPSGSYIPLRFWSVNTAGTRSDESGTSFFVYQNPGP